MSIVDFDHVAEAVLILLCALILAWLVLDDLYARKLWFRRLWDGTGLRFPHTSFSPFFRGKS